MLDIDMNSEQVSIPECLSLPFPYVLQNHSLEFLENHHDKNGFGLMHWAVCQLNFNKIEELKIHNLSFSQQSKNESSKIPQSMIKGLNKENSLFFTKGGFTPIHLLVYIYKEYKTLSRKESKGSFSFDKDIQSIKEIFKSFSLEIFKLKDKSNFTITDYCFLFECFELISIINDTDSNFSSLNNINHKTAMDIGNNYYILNKKDIKPSDISRILETLEIINHKNELDSTLKINPTTKTKNVDKI